jgi:YjbR
MKIATVRKFALGLSEVTEEPHHHFSSFRYRGKIFVTVPPDDTHIHVFVSEADREAALAMYPSSMEKLLWGGKVVGVRVSLDRAKPAEVKSLVLAAHAHRAKATPAPPKRRSGLHGSGLDGKA